MNTRDIFNSKAIAVHHANAGSNKSPYLGLGLFPAKKKMSLDLKWIKTSTGLPVSLSPSAFDTKSTIRSRQGASIDKTEMAYFKESMLLKEQDEQDILRLRDSADPYADEVIAAVYDDAETLVAGAEVVPERMRMSLLNPVSGHPSISIAANGATYNYNYDADGSFTANNYVKLTGTDSWSDTANSHPLDDIQAGQDAIEASTGNVPGVLIVNKNTMNLLVQNSQIRNYILAHNNSAVVTYGKKEVIEAIKACCDVDVIVYNKMYKDEAGVAHTFFGDGYATLVPAGALGSTWFGMTPEERTLAQRADADVTLVETGIAVAVTISEDPVQTKTTVSEVVLPSFERMSEVYAIEF